LECVISQRDDIGASATNFKRCRWIDTGTTCCILAIYDDQVRKQRFAQSFQFTL
jgi:hypothetical protein